MIVFELLCRSGDHRFEGWFSTSEDFADQSARGLLNCPVCGDMDVCKAPMAPRLGRKGNQIAHAAPPMTADKPMKSGKLPPEAVKLMQALHAAQSEALKSSRWVGNRFAEDARAMHYGEQAHETIHGQATIEEARALSAEGIEVAPLPFPVAPPEELN